MAIRSLIAPSFTKTFANGRVGIKMFGCLNRLVAKWLVSRDGTTLEHVVTMISNCLG